MKKIGFIDYFLDEWHANNYPRWISENSALTGRDFVVAYAWAEQDKDGGLDTASWCSKHGVEMLHSMEELVEKSDYIVVLSPDHPEHHERLSELALKSGKPVYMDKTFSPDLQSGQRMFQLAEENGTPLFTSSALRFTKELSSYVGSSEVRNSLEYVAVTGTGQFQNYAIHQLEMIVSLMGTGAQKIKSLSSLNGRLLVLDYGDGRRASMQQMQDVPFQVTLQLNTGEGIVVSECTDFFHRFIHAMLDFFGTGIPPVQKEETLEIMSILEAGHKALKNDDTWITIEK